MVRPALAHRPRFGRPAAASAPRRVAGVVAAEGCRMGGVTGRRERRRRARDVPRRPGTVELRLAGERAVGLLDWDFLHPGPRIDDLAYALRWFAPARSDEHALEWHHFPVVP